MMHQTCDSFCVHCNIHSPIKLYVFSKQGNHFVLVGFQNMYDFEPKAGGQEEMNTTCL